MGDFLQAVVINRLQVGNVALDQSCDGADDGGADQEDAQDLLEGSSGGQAALVQQEQQDGEHRTDDDGGQIDIRLHDGVKGLTSLQAGEQITEHVGDLNGFPRDDGHERAKRCPTGEEGDLLTERCICEGCAAASDGKHGDQLSIDQAEGDHDQQAE